MPRSIWNNKTCWILHDRSEMKKIIILIPVYNDWESVQKVLDEINSIISQMKNFHFKCIIVNDCSTNEQPKINKPKYLHSLKILNMKKNSGHARCNAFGLQSAALSERATGRSSAPSTSSLTNVPAL